MIVYAKKRYGPAEGYIASMNKSDVPAGALSRDSRDLRFSPVEQKWKARRGSRVLGDSFPLAGLLTDKWNAAPRCFLDWQSASALPYPTYGCVETNETNKQGVFYFRSVNGSGYNHEAGDDYDAVNHYPATSRDLSTFEHKVIPMWSENTTTPQGRLTTQAQRKIFCPGTRRASRTADWNLFPNAQGTPWMDNGQWNDTTSSGTEKHRSRPWGACPPLWAPRFLTTNLPTATATGPWREGDSFVVAVSFVRKDGSKSKPFIPQVKADTAWAGRYGTEFVNNNGHVIIPSTTAAVDYFGYIRLTQVPTSDDPDCVARELYRSPKVNSAAGEFPNINDLRLWEYIPNNTTTTYDSYNGNDEGLFDLGTGEIERLFATAWPKSGRYAGVFDGRHLIGYLKDHPGLILLCPTGPGDGSASANSRLNNGNDDKLITTGHYFVRVADDAGTKTLFLRYIDAATALPATPLNTKITLTAAKTLQDIVNDINSTLCTDNTANTREGGEWAACVVPGVDPQITADNIDFTNTYAYGDDSVSLLADGTTGNQRCWNNAWYGILYSTQARMAALPTYKAEFMHTEAGPTLKAEAQYGSAFTFRTNGPAWRVKPPEDAGPFVGMWPIPGAGCVVFYAKSVWRYVNVRGGSTGADEDYRLYKISDKGCIAWDSIGGGNGNVHWLSREGLCVSDGEPDHERIITLALHEPESQYGILAYEINRCVAASRGDNQSGRFTAKVLGNALYISFRSDVTAIYPDVTLEYDFSLTSGSSGLGQMLQPDGQPYPWSAVWGIGFTTFGSVVTIDGLQKLGAIEQAAAAHTTGDGRIDQFDYGTTNPDGSAIPCIGFHKTDDQGVGNLRKRCKEMRGKHKTPVGSTTLVTLYRDPDRASGGVYTLLDTGSAEFGYWAKRVKTPGQSPGRCHEIQFENDGLGSESFEWWYAEADFRGLDTKIA